MGAALLGPAPVQASVGIAVAPALIELDGAAGDAGSVDITVSNRGDEAYDAVAAIEPFEGMTGDHSAVDWSTVEPQQVRLEPGTSGTFHYRLAIPADAVSGGSYAQVAVSTRTIAAGPSASPAETTSAISGRVLIPVFLTVHGTGDLTRDVVLDRTGLFLEADGSLGLRAEVHNDGDVHVPLVGSGTITLAGLASPAPASPAAASPAAASPAPASPAAGSPAPASSPAASPAPAPIQIGLGRVLPGRSRTYAGASSIPLVPGATYDLALEMGMPDSIETTTFTPTLEGTASVVATPDLALDTLGVCLTADGTPRASMTLHDRGSLGVVPTAGFRVLDASGGQLANIGADDQALAWGGADTPYVGTMPTPLSDGAYTLVGGVIFGGGGYIEAQQPFTIGGDPSTATAPCPADPAPSASPSASPAA